LIVLAIEKTRNGVLIALGLLGCASQQQGPYFHDEQFLVLGVDPEAEARALTRQLEKNGFFVARRVHGQNFSALGFSDAQDVPQKVRVVTRRGIALALDQQTSTALSQGVRYELIDGPVLGTQDADGDGFEEIFVLVHRDAPAVTCIAAYRARDSGFVDAVDGVEIAQIDNTQAVWRAPQFCASEAAASSTSPDNAGSASGETQADVPAKTGDPPVGSAPQPAPAAASSAGVPQ
jgi:hypothetical protein